MTITSPFSFTIKKSENNNVKPFPKTEPAKEEGTAVEAPSATAEATEPVDAANKETAPVETVAKEVNTVEETLETAEETPVPRRRTKKTTEEAEEKAPEIIPVAYGAGKITLDDIAGKFVAIEDDPKWTEFETAMRERLDNIKIKSDINFGSARILLEQVTDIAIELNRRKAEIYSMDRTFMDRTIGLIPRFKDANAVGKNETERKRNVALALEAFPIGGRSKVNICDISLAIAQRKEIIDEFIADLEAKKSALFSYIAIFKAENKIFE